MPYRDLPGTDSPVEDFIRGMLRPQRDPLRLRQGLAAGRDPLGIGRYYAKVTSVFECAAMRVEFEGDSVSISAPAAPAPMSLDDFHDLVDALKTSLQRHLLATSMNAADQTVPAPAAEPVRTEPVRAEPAAEAAELNEPELAAALALAAAVDGAEPAETGSADAADSAPESAHGAAPGAEDTESTAGAFAPGLDDGGAERAGQAPFGIRVAPAKPVTENGTAKPHWSRDEQLDVARRILAGETAEEISAATGRSASAIIARVYSGKMFGLNLDSPGFKQAQETFSGRRRSRPQVEAAAPAQDRKTDRRMWRPEEEARARDRILDGWPAEHVAADIGRSVQRLKWKLRGTGLAGMTCKSPEFLAVRDSFYEFRRPKDTGQGSLPI